MKLRMVVLAVVLTILSGLVQGVSGRGLPVEGDGVITLLSVSSSASVVALPNSSFELPSTPFASPQVDSWQKPAQPATFDTNIFGAWENLAGIFANATNADRIDNAEGNQLAYLFAYPQVALYQDAFNAKFRPGRTYRVTVGVTSSKEEPLTQGSMLQLSFYYRDAATNVVTIASTNITYDTNVFSNVTHLLDYSVELSTVSPTNAWSGHNIGVQIQSIVAPNLIGGVWDLDNVRLTEQIAVPNFSFEAPATQFADPRIDSWQKEVQPATFDTNIFGAWDNLAGVFANPTGTNAGAIANAEGNQLAYLFSYPQMGLFQDYNSTDWASSTPTHAFNVKYSAGKSYRATVGVTTSTQEPLTQGATLQFSLYYRDAASNRVTIASTNITYDTNLFANPTHLLDFSVQTPVVKAGDPWVSQNIGVAFYSTVAPNLIGGVWDLDNVRVEEFAAVSLQNFSYNGSQAVFTVQSDAGLKFEILATDDVTKPINQWTSVGTVDNTAGPAAFSEIRQGDSHRFFIARQVP